MSDLHGSDEKITHLGQDAPKIIGDFAESAPAPSAPIASAHKRQSSSFFGKIANKWTGLAAIALVFGGIGSYMLFASKAAVLPNGDLFFGEYSLSADGQDVTWNSQLPKLTETSDGTLYSSRLGNAVAYYDKTAKQLIVLDRASGKRTAALNPPVAINENTGIPIRWSTDGTRILTLLYPASSSAAESYILTVSTGEWKKLTVQNPYTLSAGRWSGDDSKLIYIQNTSTMTAKLCSMSIDANSVAGTESCEDWTAWNNMAASLKPANLPADKTFSSIPNISSIAPNGTGFTVTVNTSVCPATGGSCDPERVAAAYAYNFADQKLTQLFKSSDMHYTVSSALWSPDSSTIAVFKDDGILFVRPDGTLIRSGGVTNMGGSAPEWTSYVATPPRTTSIATGAAIPHKNGSILAGTQLTRPYDSFNYMGGARVSPVDGKNFAYIPDRTQVLSGSTYVFTAPAELHLQSVLGGISTKILQLPMTEAKWRFHGWSPDGSWLLLSSSRSASYTSYNELWLVHPDGTSLMRLTGSDPYLTDYYTTYAWGSDSKGIYFTYNKWDNGTLVSTNLCQLRLDNTAPLCRPIQGLDAKYGVTPDQRAVSPDGKSLLINAHQPLNGVAVSSLLYVINIESATVKTKIPSPSDTGQINISQWAPDGTKIAFSTYPSSNQASTAGIYTVNPDGSGLTKIGSGTAWTYNFLWEGISTYGFNSVTPLRVADTRANSGMPYAGKTMKAATELAVKVAGNKTVPATAKAAVVNITAVNPTANNYLAVYPTGAARPQTSVVNLKPGDVRNNQATVGVGTDGQITIFNAFGNVDVIVDVVGYYDQTGSYLSLSNPPKRLADTRLTPNSTQTLTVNPADFAGKTGAELNLTMVQPIQPGYLTTYPAGETLPTSSSLNYVKGDVLAKASTAKVSAKGVSIYNMLPFTQANTVVDLVGTYSTSAGLSYAPIVPQRIADTRTNSGMAYAGQHIGAGGTLKVQLPANAPAGVKGIVANVTVPSTTAAGSYMTLYRSDIARPDTSNINFGASTGIAFNQATVAVDDSRSFSIFNGYGTSDVIIDVMGYYY